jgi:glutathione peroxidase
VNGDGVAPIYKFLKSSKGSIFGDNIKWNFAKFLVDKEGRVVDRYAPTTSPLSIEVSCSSTPSAPFSSKARSSSAYFCASLQKDLKKLLA